MFSKVSTLSLMFLLQLMDQPRPILVTSVLAVRLYIAKLLSKIMHLGKMTLSKTIGWPLCNRTTDKTGMLQSCIGRLQVQREEM